MNERTPLANSIEVLKILYMVVAGLALVAGLERFLLGEDDQLNWPSFISFILFIIFITTVVRFVHGAMRTFDQTYKEQPQRVNWMIRQPLWDFFGLGLEASFFFILAFSINDSIRFISWYLLLLLIDSAWLSVVVWPGKKVFFSRKFWEMVKNRIVKCRPNIRYFFYEKPGSTPRNWIIANSFVLFPTGIPWLVYGTYTADNCPLWAWVVFPVGIFFHSIVDYPWNKSFYFGKSRNINKGLH